MGFKMGSIVMILMLVFIAKISLESAIGEKEPEKIHERTTASIDQSYYEQMGAD
ncbi:MAG TPA: hypothetical protein VNJ01_09580 [Bacteriovoracaceae bacterium]|nr:hypothetical protein [Bacteriovoracaceae bacterium]